MPPWAAIGGAIGGAIFLIALIGCCCFCWYRKRNNQARDLENTTADISDTKNTIVLLSTPVNEIEKTGFGHGRNLEEADLTTQVAATGEYGSSELSLQQQVFNAPDQILANSTVPPTADSHSVLSPGTPCALPLSTHFSPKSGGLGSYQQPLPQIAASSFRATVNGEAAIPCVLREKDEARREYKQAVAAGKTVYLLEQEATDGKCLKDMAGRTRKLTILQSSMLRWVTSSQGLHSKFEYLLP